MSILRGVLLEEIDRLKANISNYENILKELPKGSIFVRKMNNASFVYRKQRVKEKIVSEYIGPLNSEKAKLEIEKSNNYKRVKNNIALAKKELVKLQKAVKAYE